VNAVPAATEDAGSHAVEYGIEALCLGLFMISAVAFAALLFHPSSPLDGSLPDGFLRRALMGIAMGATAILLIRSPFGRRSGAHMNPAVTLTYLRLGKVAPQDALFYVIAQFVGAVAGVLLARGAIGAIVADPSVHYVATLPGPSGQPVAFVAELLISFVLMLAVLFSTNSPRLARHTPFIAGALVALYISVEAPLSGMSMNPARSFGSAVFAGALEPLWIYFVAPPLGMLLAAETYTRLGRTALCAKLDHFGRGRCIFRCRFDALEHRS
jgi:aquaporin Z